MALALLIVRQKTILDFGIGERTGRSAKVRLFLRFILICNFFPNLILTVS